MARKIIENKAQCKNCQDIIQSKDTNDFKRCSCGSIAVDGGLDYIKRIGNLDDVFELSKCEGDEIMKEEKEVYCTCENIKSVHSENDDFMRWDVCDDCGKVVEFSFESLENFENDLD